MSTRGGSKADLLKTIRALQAELANERAQHQAANDRFDRLLKSLGRTDDDIGAENERLREALKRLADVCEQDDIKPHVIGHLALASAALKGEK